MRDIERVLKAQIERETISGFAPLPAAETSDAAPANARPGNRNARGNGSGNGQRPARQATSNDRNGNAPKRRRVRRKPATANA